MLHIQDSIKFADLVHAIKPESRHQMPQSARAYDTFWDFVSLMPESTHMLMWQVSDRTLPRSYATMQGFGVHSFRFVNDAGESVFVKFHWTPKAGTLSLVWDEAVKISGADPDYPRRDLWERIESGAYPEHELGVQVFTEEQAEQVAFCTAHVVPGTDFSNDPLLGGHLHSYVDTQISRLSGPNFHEIPINSPIVQVDNN